MAHAYDFPGHLVPKRANLYAHVCATVARARLGVCVCAAPRSMCRSMQDGCHAMWPACFCTGPGPMCCRSVAALRQTQGSCRHAASATLHLSISVPSRHRRRHAYCAGVDEPALKRIRRGGRFEYWHVHTRVLDHAVGDADILLSTGTSTPAQCTCRRQC